MSLADIHAMRLARQKPHGVVSVVIGDVGPEFNSDPFMVRVKTSDTPAFLDLRPLVGCWVAVYNIARDKPLMDRLMQALSDAGVKLFGFVHLGVAYPLTVPDPDLDYKISYSMRGQWELLCK